MFAPIYNLQMVASAEELWSPKPLSGMAGEHTEATAMVEMESQVKNQHQMQLQHNRNLQKLRLSNPINLYQPNSKVFLSPQTYSVSSISCEDAQSVF